MKNQTLLQFGSIIKIYPSVGSPEFFFYRSPPVMHPRSKTNPQPMTCKDCLVATLIDRKIDSVGNKMLQLLSSFGMIYIYETSIDCESTTVIRFGDTKK